VAEGGHPTRAALLDAGLRLADERDLVGIAVDDIVREAGVAKGTFYVHFADRAAYLVELHGRFHEALALRVAAATKGLAPGRARIERATAAYLDGCRRSRGVKAMLAQARALPEIAAAVSVTNARFATAARADFAAAGSARPAEAARLYVVMTAEVALAELHAGRRQNNLRAALSDYLGA
jgi:TetR/AcrR family transcriptional repressor of nem operon